MQQFISDVIDFITSSWVAIVIVVTAIVLANIIYFLFMKIFNKDKKTTKEPIVNSVRLNDADELTDEERKVYDKKISYLEARVKELEAEVSKYEIEVNDAKMTTMNLTNALEELQKNVDNHETNGESDEIVDEFADYEDDSSITIVEDTSNINTEEIIKAVEVEQQTEKETEVVEQPTEEETKVVEVEQPTEEETEVVEQSIEKETEEVEQPTKEETKVVEVEQSIEEETEVVEQPTEEETKTVEVKQPTEEETKVVEVEQSTEEETELVEVEQSTEEETKAVEVEQPTETKLETAMKNNINSVSTSDESIPERIQLLRNAVYQNIRKVTAEYESLDADSSVEKIEEVKNNLYKAKKQLEQYKTIASKYKDQ